MKPSDRHKELDRVTLTGRLKKSSDDDMVIIEADGALLSVRKDDVRGTEERPEGLSAVHVASDARILFETLLTPQEAGGILTRDIAIELRAEPTECSRCSTECSRCSTECSRCASLEFGGGFVSGGFRRRLR